MDTIVKLKIVPHPKLTDAGKAAIELDYGMEGGPLVLETRAGHADAIATLMRTGALLLGATDRAIRMMDRPRKRQ
jgi:hypothetical protein